MTTAIVLPDHSFPVHVPLYDIPNFSNNRVFAIYGGTLLESLLNHSGRNGGAAVGSLNVEPMGIRQAGMSDYVRYSDLGEMSSDGFTLLVAFRAPVVGMISGLASLWSAALKNNETNRRRIFIDGSSGGEGPLRLSSFPLSGGADWAIDHDAPYLVSMVRARNGMTSHFRLHGADGSVISEKALPTAPGAITYAEDIVLEVGNGSSAATVPSLIQGVGLWSGPMKPNSVVEAAASLALASGVFD